MGKQHQTMPGEPEEAPLTPMRPEIERPGDPQAPKVPEEAPDRQPEEVPQHPEPRPEAELGKPGEGGMQASVAAELRNRE